MNETIYHLTLKTPTGSTNKIRLERFFTTAQSHIDRFCLSKDKNDQLAFIANNIETGISDEDFRRIATDYLQNLQKKILTAKHEVFLTEVNNALMISAPSNSELFDEIQLLYYMGVNKIV